MNCHYCKKELTNPGIEYKNLVFCNNLCKYSWERIGETPILEDINSGSSGGKVFLENLDFALQLPGFENRDLLIRGSYFRGARLFIDGKAVKPVERKYFKRTRKFIIKNNFGNDIEILLRNRYYDAIPAITVNKYEIVLDKKITWFDYIFISSPIVLMFLGGLIGFLIGGGAVFTNSILFRKTNNKLLKYSFIITNTIIAFILYFKIIIFILPLIEELKLKLSDSISSNSEISNSGFASNLTKQVWQLNKVTTLDGKDVTDYKGIYFQHKKYFIGGGEFTEILQNGLMVRGKWHLDINTKILTLTFDDREDKVDVISINENEFIYQFANMNFIHKAI